MHRIATVLGAAALLLLVACSTEDQAAGSAAPAPSVSAPSRPGPFALDSPLLKVAPRPTRAPTATAATQPPPRPSGPQVPIVGTDPGGRLPATSTEPTRLEVGRVDLRMDVVGVGTDDDGNMALPESVSDVGWYEYGARPSDRRGATVLAAHVDSIAEGVGPFARLRNLRPGENVVVTDRGGTVHRYRVASVKSVPKTDVPLGDLFDRDARPTLVLITCGGAYDRGTGYRDNVVVTATPVSES